MSFINVLDIDTSIGIIPIDERPGAPLTWALVI